MTRKIPHNASPHLHFLHFQHINCQSIALLHFAFIIKLLAECLFLTHSTDNFSPSTCCKAISLKKAGNWWPLLEVRGKAATCYNDIISVLVCTGTRLLGRAYGYFSAVPQIYFNEKRVTILKHFLNHQCFSTPEWFPRLWVWHFYTLSDANGNTEII